ncbi:Vacuolar protein sorting-associated protein 21 [Hypoxylon texense]
MAALTPAQIELANTLTAAELPTKLRCAVCSQSTLPSVCPVCEHSPVSASDCTVYKSLRTTIRVFLKTEEKKREAARPKTNGSTPATPAQDTPTPTPIQARAPTEPPSADTTVPERDGIEPQTTDPTAHSTVIESIESSTANLKQDDDTQEDAPVNGHAQEQPVGDDEDKALVPGEQEGQDGTVLEESQENDQDEEHNDQPAQPGMGAGFDSMAGNFNMNFGNGDMSQMQMLMAMQNGMNPAAFGSFPMMGMMDPMTMQNMMMSGGFGAQGMGMNGMNMNMGMNGFNGGNDWNGQQSWNVGQDNFNPNTRGMGNGDYGNYNSGFRTGFNSGNYGHHNQFNDYRRGNYGFRGRGRGRGFYNGHGRGFHHGYNNVNAGWAGQGPQFSNGKDGQAALDDSQVTGQPSGNVDEFGRAIRPESNDDAQNAGEDEHAEAGSSHDNTTVNGVDKLARENSEQAPKEDGSPSVQDVPADDKGDVSSRDQHSAPQGPSRGSAGQMHPQTTAQVVPFNAPTGPKAMRQGLPNTSLHHLRARGFIPDEKGQSQTSRTNQPSIVASPTEDKLRSRSSSPHSSKDKERRLRERDREHDEDDKNRARRRDRDRDRSKTYTASRSRTRSRSHSRDRKESRKHRRHRSPSVSGDDRDAGHRHRRHKGRKQSTRDEDDYRGRPRDEKHEERARSASPVDREHRRSGHRSRRDRDEKRRDRDNRDIDRESDYDRHRKSGHRSHRDRDQDRERNKEREKGRDKDYTRDRDEDRHHHKGSTAQPTTAEPSDKTFNPPTGPRGGSFSIKGASNKPAGSGIEIKGASNRPSNSERRESVPSRRPSQSSVAGQKSAAGGPTKDPHTLEREARNRERLLKEAQRIAVIAGRGGGVKRGREANDDRGSSRRKSRRSEAVNTEDEEDRMRRLEAEREGRRWD